MARGQLSSLILARQHQKVADPCSRGYTDFAFPRGILFQIVVFSNVISIEFKTFLNHFEVASAFEVTNVVGSGAITADEFFLGQPT